MSEHTYRLHVTWQGNRGEGTTGYRSYGRQVLLQTDGKPDLAGSADPTFRGDADRWNPEEMLLAALAQCHLLSYLHHAVRHGVVVTGYTDAPVATLTQEGIGGHVTGVVLRPRVTVRDPAMVEDAQRLHGPAGASCFIASSVSFPVTHEPVTEVAG